MDRAFILAEIRRVADANGGVAPGLGRFLQDTGIKREDWLGRYWARWSEAVAEAGYEPNLLNQPHDTLKLLGHLRDIVDVIGKWPARGDLMLYARQAPGFPYYRTFGRLGTRAEQASAMLANRDTLNLSERVVAVCEAIAVESAASPVTGAGQSQGFVYLLKSGRYHKIGRANDASRRAYELRLLLPEKATVIHQIETDDPAGIEVYWHRRFADRRANGEWFLLSAADVAAFKARKSM